MITKQSLAAQGYDHIDFTPPPANAMERLNKALIRAINEGNGTVGLQDITVQFFNATTPEGVLQYVGVAIELNSTQANFVSGYDTWHPKGRDEAGKDLYDCHAVALGIQGLGKGTGVMTTAPSSPNPATSGGLPDASVSKFDKPLPGHPGCYSVKDVWQLHVKMGELAKGPEGKIYEIVDSGTPWNRVGIWQPVAA